MGFGQGKRLMPPRLLPPVVPSLLRQVIHLGVLWGKFEFTRLKVLRLNEVMKDASRKTAGPLRADLRSFREGKIFVSAIKQAVIPKKPARAGAF